MHFNSVVFLFLAVSCVYLFSSCDAARQKVTEDKIESTTSRKKIESTSRGSVKYLLPQPTVKNKKFQVTSPPTEEITENYPPSYKKPATPKRPPPVKKTPPQTKKRTQPQVVKEETQEYEKFPSLAGLVYIELPTSSPPTTTTSTTTSRPTKRKTVAPVTSAKRVTQTTTQRPRTTTNAPKNTKKMVADFTCPKPEKIPFQWFPLPCDSHKQCTRQMGKNYRCCEINSNSFKACTKGIVKMVPEQKHAPLFGVPVKCPKVPLAEIFFNVQACETDNDCWPRVCCPDGKKRFCRTPNPEFKEAKNPIARQLMQPYKSATSFIQCTAPSPFDIHPKPCNTTLDCFPNLCCQEGNQRNCRPPKRSLFSMVASSVSRTLWGN